MKELKDLVGFGLSVIELIADIADGVSFSIVSKFVSLAVKAKPALSGAVKALEQYRAMSDEQALELEVFVQEEFDIDQEQVEKVIEQIMWFVISIHQLVNNLLPQSKVQKV